MADINWGSAVTNFGDVLDPAGIRKQISGLGGISNFLTGKAPTNTPTVVCDFGISYSVNTPTPTPTTKYNYSYPSTNPNNNYPNSLPSINSDSSQTKINKIGKDIKLIEDKILLELD